MSNLLCKCQVCGALLDEEDLFCTECGTEAPVQQQVTQTKLPTYDSTHNFTCQGCGASMSYDAQARGLRCPFCGSESMQADDDAKEIQPSYIVPFVLDRQQAIQCLRQQLARSFWSPNDTSQQAVVDKIQPIYVPYWAFSAHTETFWAADSSATPASARASWYPVSGEHHGHYENILICCSSALTTAEMHDLSNYDLSAAVSPEQIDLHEVTNERFTVPRKYARPIARRSLEQEEYQACQQYIRGSHRNLKVNVRIQELNSVPVLLPIWIMAYRYQNQIYRFIVNGQNGRSTGKVPISWTKIVLAITIGLILFGLLMAIMLFH